MKRVLVAVVLVGLTATGCGGGSSTKKASLANTPSPTATATSTASALPSALPSVGAGVLSADCRKAAEAFSKSGAALGSKMSTDLATQLSTLAAELKSLKAQVPSGKVRDAVQTLSSAYAHLADTLKGVHYTPKAGNPPPAEYLAAIREFANPKFSAAASTLGMYFAGHCKG